MKNNILIIALFTLASCSSHGDNDRFSRLIFKPKKETVTYKENPQRFSEPEVVEEKQPEESGWWFW